ncbi:MAG: DsbA family protein [Leucobacter sp.]
MAKENGTQLSKNERRAQAREQARLAREREKKREKRNRLLLQGGVVVGVLAILGIVALILTQTMKPAGPGPENMASGGVVIEKDLAVRQGPALEDGEKRVAPEVDRDKLPLDVTVYVDYSCSHCASFEQQNGEMLGNWVGSGDSTVEIYPVNILDTTATNNYSTRAANLLSCVVNGGSEDGVVFSLHNQLLSAEIFDKMQTQGGLSDDELVALAEQNGADADEELKQCVKDQRFGSFITQNTAVATQEGIVGLAKGARLIDDSTTGTLQPAGEPQKLRGTPLVIVNGQQWNANEGTLDNYLAKIKGEIEQNGGSSKNAEDDSAKSDTTAGDEADKKKSE